MVIKRSRQPDPGWRSCATPGAAKTVEDRKEPDIVLQFADASGKGAWIPDGWEIPIFLGSMAIVVIMVAVARWRRK